MCTKFTALEVGKGDAFLLQNQGWNCLFDAGQYSNIIKILKDKGIHRLHLAICSHNDVDHAKGLIELLKDGSIAIDEIWLPGYFANIIQFVTEHLIDCEEIEFIARYKYPDELNYQTDGRDVEFNHSKNENNDKINELLFGNDPLTVPIDNLNDDCYKRLRYCLDCLLCYKSHQKSFPHIFKRLERIMEIAILAYKKNCKIRWFEPIKGCAKNSIDYGLKALNSKEIIRVKKLINLHAFAFAIHLSVVNIYSLVYEYWNDNLPIVRFSADSDCECQSAPYNNHIIVTAPHHGSDNNRKVFNAINNNNVIWVRSDCKTKKRPCDVFKNLKNKYCLACYTHGFRKEIIFEYDKVSKQWNYVCGELCRCK